MLNSDNYVFLTGITGVIVITGEQKLGRKMNSPNYDIVIVGGGIVGLTLAAALAKYPLKISVLEKSMQQQPSCLATCYAQRVSAITLASESAFRQLGVWQAMADRRVNSFQRMFVWDSIGQGSIAFDAGKIGQQYLGHIIENQVITDALTALLQQQQNVNLYYGVSCEDYTSYENHAEISTEKHGSISATLFIAADGVFSWLRQQAGIEQHIKPYQQTAIVATVACEKSHQDTAWQSFLPSGPLAFLPLQSLKDQKNICSIVWSVETTEAERLLQLPTDVFNQTLAEAFTFKLGKVNVLDQRLSFPLIMRHAKNYFQDHVVLMGDAAHTIHPLAGQGLNLGILDALAFSDCVSQALMKNKSLTSTTLLRRYERWRKTDNQIMLKAMSGFKQLFSNDIQWLAALRSYGLTITNHISPMKQFFMRYAMGLSGNLPSLARYQSSLFLD